MVECLMRAVAVPGLNVQQQIETLLEGAMICSRLGMKKKYAFLLFLVALLSAESENRAVAYSLVQCACRQYGVSVQLEMENTGVGGTGCGWPLMQRVVLAHCTHFAKEFGDLLSTSRCVCCNFICVCCYLPFISLCICA